MRYLFITMLALTLAGQVRAESRDWIEEYLEQEEEAAVTTEPATTEPAATEPATDPAATTSEPATTTN